MNYKTKHIDKIKFKYPTVLYKYRCWDNDLHKKILTEKKLYLASPKEFEDKHDCYVLD